MSWDDPHNLTSQEIPSGQQDQGQDYQQPKSFRSGSGSVPQGVKEVSHLGPKFLILVKNRSNTIPLA